MLLELKARGLGIIEEIDWNLSPGLNIVTGETGAGKSLIIDALEALLGGKMDEEIIRHGDEEARVEGIFVIPGQPSMRPLKELLAEKGFEKGEDTLVISFELRRQGRSVIRVNGRAVPRSILQQIGRLLVDIHGQSQHLSLLDTGFHLDFLDAYAHALDLRRHFGDMTSEYYKVHQEIKAMDEASRDRARREEFLRFQFEEISRSKLKAGEDKELELEQNILLSCEKLKTFSGETYEALCGDDSARTSALDRLNEAVQLMKRVVELDPALKQQLAFMEETAYGLEEAGRDIRTYCDRLENNPGRLDELETRLELIKDLKRKYGPSISDILAYGARTESELNGLSASTEKRSELEENLSRLKTDMGDVASELSAARAKGAKKLITEVEKELKELDLAQVKFEVMLKQTPDPQGIPFPNGETFAFNETGVDSVEFIVATNPGEPLKPLARIASTGELSRFMLALKGALASADSIPVLVFDEIDIGVGGRSGEIIGRKLWNLARDRQVICVTHLPQIAAFADAHYRVHKETVGSRTLSKLETLGDAERLEELASMLGGPDFTETSLGGARELEQKAGEWKKSHGNKAAERPHTKRKAAR